MDQQLFIKMVIGDGVLMEANMIMKLGYKKELYDSTELKTYIMKDIRDGFYTDASGCKRWYVNGQLHREDGPAFISGNNTQYWFQYGLYHRLDGPAIIYTKGSPSWYIKGREYTKKEFQNQLIQQNLKALL